MFDYQQNEFYQPGPNRMAKAFSSPLFLAFAILVSTNNLIALIYGGVPDVFTILFTVGVWLIYSAAYTSATNPSAPLKSTGFSFISGTVRGMKIFYLVISIILIVAGVILLSRVLALRETILSTSFYDLRSFFEKGISDPDLYFEVSKVLDNVALSLEQLGFDLGVNFGPLLFAICLGAVISFIVTGTIFLVISLTFMSKLRKFTVIVRDSVKLGIAPSRVKGLGVWCLVLGIILVTFSPAWGAALIVFCVWYKKFFPATTAVNHNTQQ